MAFTAARHSDRNADEVKVALAKATEAATVLRRHRDRDEKELHAADRRNCDRSNLARAVLRLYPAPPEVKAFRMRVLPINDCSPDLRGKPAVPLSRAQDARYLRLLATTEKRPRTLNGRVYRGR